MFAEGGAMAMERRAFERVGVEVKAEYHVKELFKETEYPCVVTDITEEGIGIQTEVEDTPFGVKPKGGLKPGTTILMKLENMEFHCKVVYVETSGVGLRYEKVTPELIESIKKYFAS
jgi:hypothetical protein